MSFARPSDLPALAAAADVSAAPRARIDALDGLRGWASLSVVLFHLVWELFGIIEPGFRNPVTAFLLGGNLAVCLFFVLSGAALSVSALAGGGGSAITRMAVKRYPRLVIPIFASCCIVFAIERAGLDFHLSAAEIVERSDWLGRFQHPPLSVVDVLRYAFVDVFYCNNIGGIDPFLWTMKVELLGSVIVFALLYALPWLPSYRAVLAIAFIILAVVPSLLANQFACFFAGMLIADDRVKNSAGAGRQSRLPVIAVVLFLLVVLLDDVQWLQDDLRFKALFAAGLVVAVFMARDLEGFFASPLSRVLGRLSFPLFLMQYPVIMSFASWLILRFRADGRLDLLHVVLIIVASLALCFAAAIAFEPVERCTHVICRSLVVRLQPLMGRSAMRRTGG